MGAEPLISSAPRALGKNRRLQVSVHATRLRQHLRGRIIWAGIAFLWLLTALFVWGGSSFYLFTVNSCLLAVFGAIALNLLMGTAGLVSIGNSAFLAVGAFGAVFALRSGIPFPVDIVVAGVFSALAGLILGLPAVRLRGLHLALATLAGFFIVTYLVGQYQTHAKNAGAGGFTIPTLFQSRGLVGAQKDWAWLLILLVSLLLLGARRLGMNRAGRAWRMIRDHEEAAQALGMPVVRYKLVAFVVSSSVIGIQGALLSHLTGSISYDQFTLDIAIAYVAMVLIGGLDSVAGAVTGAILVTALPILVPKLVAGIIGARVAATKGSQISEIIYGVLVVVFVSSSPRGLAGLTDRLFRSGFSQQIKATFRRAASAPPDPLHDVGSAQ